MSEPTFSRVQMAQAADIGAANQRALIRRELGETLMEMRGTILHLTLNEDSLSASLAEGIKKWADRLEEATGDA